ncbi:uncharacterized protein [Spinacia oleracea]|uniref:Uncharacterized protein n=1 Tax=Spinacia oleracea TaxID=3562 RepID=A0ABM3QWC0_SPIOL|nr:uncharacterized protein LOC130462768 [Spinacia oleracea]
MVKVPSRTAGHEHESSSWLHQRIIFFFLALWTTLYEFGTSERIKIQMADYEKLRQAMIEEKRIRMKDLGVTSMAYQMKQSMKGSKQTKKSKKVTKNTDEYTPDEEGELNHSSEEDENEIRKNGVNLRSRSKKVVPFSDSLIL